MSNVHKFPQLDQRYTEASEWISKLDKGMTSTDRVALKKWMASSDDNQAVLLEMASLWDSMSVMSRLSELFPNGAVRSGKSPKFAWAIAATIFVAVVAGIWAVTAANPDYSPSPQQVVVEASPEIIYETAIGQRSTVYLPDGTRVVLNTNSRIEVEYSKTFRLLNLKYGEIHVEVMHDEDRPLSVIAGDRVVKAVGTAFSLEITVDHRVELVVTEGKVLVGVVNNSDKNRDAAVHSIEEEFSVAVAAGEQFMLDDPAEEILEVSPEDIEVKLSWRNGDLVFRGESLEDALAEIGRYTTVEFVVLDDNLKKVRIAGLFKAGDVDGLLATLREHFDVSYQRTGDGKILLTNL